MRMTELENYYRKVEISCQIAIFNEIFHALRINAKKKSIDKRNGTKSRKKTWLFLANETLPSNNNIDSYLPTGSENVF